MKIFCIGRNYLAHAKEMGSKAPSKPIVFMKPPTALLRDDKPFYYPNFSNEIHHELEIVIKISKNGKTISESQALQYIESIGLGIDFTARDLQRECKENGRPWEISKSFDYSAVLGNLEDISHYDLNNLDFHLLKNKQVVQKSNTKAMLFSFAKIISYISTYFTFKKGDLIYTGTPEGVGPVVEGDLLEGYLNEKKLLHCRIK